MVPSDGSFSKLTQAEWDELLLIPVWIALLIAGADNFFSKGELKKAIKIILEESLVEGRSITPYCKQVADKFAVNLKGYKTLLPLDFNRRTDFLVTRISRVNILLKKIPLEAACEVYEYFRKLAIAVAKSSGGIFGMLSVSYSESRWIDLKMIQNPGDPDH